MSQKVASTTSSSRRNIQDTWEVHKWPNVAGVLPNGEAEECDDVMGALPAFCRLGFSHVPIHPSSRACRFSR